MILEARNGRGFCDDCDAYSHQLYYYKLSNDTSTRSICESCIPKCDVCNVEFALSEKHDHCEECEKKVQEEEAND